MKKRVLSLISAVLVLVMLWLPSSAAFAKNSVTPIIIIHGVGANPVYENVGTNDEAEIKNLGLGEVTNFLTTNGILSEAVKLLSNQVPYDYDKLLDNLSAYFEGNAFNLNADGTAKAGQGINNYWETPMSQHKDYWKNGTISETAIVRQICKTAGAKNVYCFNYDWRIDAKETADKLNVMIKNVKKSTGAKKVALVGCSFGGAVLSAYIDSYKSLNDVKRYVFVNPAMYGVDVTRMYAGDIKINKKQVMKYLNGMQDANPGSTQQTIFKVVKILGDVRVGIAADNFNAILKDANASAKLAQKVIKPWFGNVAALWECIPYDVFDAAVEYTSSIGVLDKSSGLYAKISAYHGIQGRFKKNIKYVKKHGAEVAIIANYGEPGIPVTSKANNHIDGLIDTCRASGGATVADFGKKLKGKKAKGKYVSPDKVINAKTCVLPKNTWFIKGVQHMQFKADTQATEFIAKLAAGKVKLNIKSVKKKYGLKQFISSDENQNISNVKK